MTSLRLPERPNQTLLLQNTMLKQLTTNSSVTSSLNQLLSMNLAS